MLRIESPLKYLKQAPMDNINSQIVLFGSLPFHNLIFVPCLKFFKSTSISLALMLCWQCSWDPDRVSSSSFGKKWTIWVTVEWLPRSLSHAHTYTRRNKFNFSTMIINTRVMQTSRWQAIVSLLSSEYVTVKLDSILKNWLDEG